MRRCWFWLGAIMFLIAGAGARGQSGEVAQGLLDALDAEKTRKLQFEFDNEEERKDWSNLPARMHKRNGLSFGEMTDPQKIAAYRLLETGLSSQGYAKVTGVMRLDDVWAEIVNQNRPGVGSSMFGSDKYWLAFFGKPDDGGVWGWQVDGHHLGINATLAGGDASFSPMFFGAEPDVVPSGQYAGWRIFGAERAKAFALVESLSDGQRESAILEKTVPAGIFEGPGDGGAIKVPRGLRASEMNESQQTLLWALIDEYLNNAPAKTAATQRAKILSDGLAKLYFAWMGPVDESANIYFRVHGPSVLIEYDNVFAGPANRNAYSNHIHTILRDPSDDFGEDLLRKHYAQHEHGKLGGR